MDFAQKPRYGSSYMMGSMNTGQGLSGLPKSFSTSVTSSWSSNLEGEDLRELIRANSTTNTNDPNNKLRVAIDVELYLKQLIKEQQMKQQQQLQESKSKGGVVPRSCSVGMGKIDEDKPFEEEEEEEDEDGGTTDLKKGTNRTMFPRSKSHAVRI